MATHTIACTVTVERPASQVAAHVLDWGNDAAWRAAVRGFEVEPPGRAVVGQRLVETLVFAGLTFRTPTTVVEAEPLRVAYAGGNRQFGVRGSREVVALGPQQCELRTVTELTGQGLMRALAPLLAPSYRRADAADLRGLAEQLAVLAS